MCADSASGSHSIYIVYTIAIAVRVKRTQPTVPLAICSRTDQRPRDSNPRQASSYLPRKKSPSWGRCSVRCVGENVLQMSGFLVERREHVDASGGAVGVVVGCGVAGGGAGAAGGSGTDRCVAGA